MAYRRLIYLQTILKRSDDEITKKVFECQRNNPVKGDWSEMAQGLRLYFMVYPNLSQTFSIIKNFTFSTILPGRAILEESIFSIGLAVGDIYNWVKSQNFKFGGPHSCLVG